ncbi:hypothetical protein FIBSPDRAFT_864555, partial [Athelia psychrophila]
MNAALATLAILSQSARKRGLAPISPQPPHWRSLRDPLIHLQPTSGMGAGLRARYGD